MKQHIDIRILKYTEISMFSHQKKSNLCIKSVKLNCSQDDILMQ